MVHVLTFADSSAFLGPPPCIGAVNDSRGVGYVERQGVELSFINVSMQQSQHSGFLCSPLAQFCPIFHPLPDIGGGPVVVTVSTFLTFERARNLPIVRVMHCRH